MADDARIVKRVVCGTGIFERVKRCCYIQGMSNGLDVLLMEDPCGEFSEHDKSTDIEFGGTEWESFFFKTLGVTLPEFIESETFDE